MVRSNLRIGFLAVLLLAFSSATGGVCWGAVNAVNKVLPKKEVLVSVVVRNPFQPPPVVTKRLLQNKGTQRRVPLTPLERYDLESFVLTGIVADMAMVVSPDGSTYIIRRGTRIGKRGEVVVGVYRDRVAIKRGKKIIYLTFPKD